MACFVNLFATLEVRAFRTVENEQWQERRPHQSSAPKEQGTQDRVFSFLPIFGMKEPYTRVYSDPKPAKSLNIGNETFGDR